MHLRPSFTVKRNIAYLTKLIADTLYEALGAVATHVALSDPHSQYQKESEKGAINGYASLDGGGKIPDTEIPSGIARDSEISAAISTHEAASDPHPVYLTSTEGNALYDGLGFANSAYLAAVADLATHVAASDPHPGYLTPAEGNAAYSALAHTHLLTGITDVTITVANLNSLDDGVDSVLHFHDSDRARGNHTGTQLLTTLSDVSISAANLNSLDDGVNSTLHFHNSDRDRGNHIGSQLLATISNVSITAENLNALDDLVTTGLHFHDSDRARANHTGTQAASTIIDKVAVANVNTTAVGNVGIGEDNLITYSLSANSLDAAGKGIRVTAWGTKANNGNAKTVKIYFGSTAMATLALATGIAGQWSAQAVIFSTGVDTQTYNATLQEHNTAFSNSILIDHGVSTSAQDDGAAIIIKCTGTGTSNNDIVQTGLLVEYLK